MKKNDTRLWMYSNMVKSRVYEERIKVAYLEGKQPLFNMAKGPVPGEMHLSNGQEPCAVGVCAHLRADDAVTATHRPHHIAIAKGVDLKGMTAEIFGKEAGLSGGKGGHMHIFDAKVNFACSGIIAEGMGPAVGAAVAAKMRGSDAVAVSFIGEGAANQGAFHESLNLAAVWKAPVVFIIEDNSWGISVHKDKSTAVKRNSDRASAYGMPGYFIEKNDPDKIYEVAGEAISRARRGEGPTLIEIETVRLEGHFMGDAEGYRPESEKTALASIDPIPLYRAKLIAEGIAEEALLHSIEAKATAEVDAVFAFARATPLPAPEQAFDCVFMAKPAA
ncbi:thiamine pyrophosphate-dependent dehydrogenase E1 component subunit alpha [Kordiimonas pumila]|uniref:Thiamine pyrophosphate-dependent dehydrogenase E1 component subunit alpha n=1 Tax=Kordiimonas pumila TaxID=2161677 RepID=A0ABV7D8K5_9PROT|nr:thiamine pyrophosphate-dependent dehydrogenase E1 component subunit alpha [Kordiimonas pumila]